MIKVVISIINYNRATLTKECLKSLENLKQDTIDLEVVVIDNASKEALMLDKKEFPKLKLSLIKSPVNTGFSGGHNLGFAYGLENGADYVVILNNDITVDPELIISLIEAGEKNEKAGIIAPKIYFSKGSEYHKDRYKPSDSGRVLWYAGGIIDWDNVYWKHRGVDEVDSGQYDKEEITQYASGCCFAIKRKVLEEIKGFDETYFLYYEDSDLNERVKQKGYQIIYAPDALMWHINAGSTGGSGSKLQDYFTTRNRLVLGFCYASKRAKFALVRESIKTVITGREWQKKGVVDFYLRRFGKGSYPL